MSREEARATNKHQERDLSLALWRCRATLTYFSRRYPTSSEREREVIFLCFRYVVALPSCPSRFSSLSVASGVLPHLVQTLCGRGCRIRSGNRFCEDAPLSFSKAVLGLPVLIFRAPVRQGGPPKQRQSNADHRSAQQCNTTRVKAKQWIKKTQQTEATQ